MLNKAFLLGILPFTEEGKVGGGGGEQQSNEGETWCVEGKVGVKELQAMEREREVTGENGQR